MTRHDHNVTGNTATLSTVRTAQHNSASRLGSGFVQCLRVLIRGTQMSTELHTLLWGDPKDRTAKLSQLWPPPLSSLINRTDRGIGTATRPRGQELAWLIHPTDRKWVPVPFLWALAQSPSRGPGWPLNEKSALKLGEEYKGSLFFFLPRKQNVCP